MRSRQKLFVVLFFLFFFCEPSILTMARKYLFLCHETTEAYRCNDERIVFVTATAYSSTHDQTDNSPFIMASGNQVYDGAIAANFLPVGTKVMLPELYGEKIFTVEDRTHGRFAHRVDIWMGTREEALQFGIKQIAMKVL